MFKQADRQKRGPFGTTVDPVAAGRAGGLASAAGRKDAKRRRMLDELRAGVLASRSGYAKLKLAEQLEAELPPPAPPATVTQPDYNAILVSLLASLGQEHVAELLAEAGYVLEEVDGVPPAAA